MDNFVYPYITNFVKLPNSVPVVCTYCCENLLYGENTHIIHTVGCMITEYSFIHYNIYICMHSTAGACIQQST